VLLEPKSGGARPKKMLVLRAGSVPPPPLLLWTGAPHFKIRFGATVYRERVGSLRSIAVNRCRSAENRGLNRRSVKLVLGRCTRDQQVPGSVLTHCAVEYGPPLKHVHNCIANIIIWPRSA